MLVLDVCASYVREPVLKSAAVLCRGVAWVCAGGCVGLSALSGEHGVRASDRRRSSGARRGRAPCGAWRNASQRPCVPRPNTRGGHGGHGHGPRRRPRAAPAACALAARGSRPRPGRTGNRYEITVFLQKWSRVLFVLGGITGDRSAHAPAQSFRRAPAYSARARLRSAVSSVSHSISAISRRSAVLQCSSSREPVPHTVAGALGAPQTSQHTSPCCPVAAVSAARPASDAC